MNYNLFREGLYRFKIFSLTDIRKIFPSFDSRRLVEWQEKGYIKKVINRWYIFADVPVEDRLLLWTANRIYQPSYISLETALSYYGLIPEGVFTTTSISTLKTKSFDTPLGTFAYRHVKSELFFGYRIVDWQGFPIKMAEPEKVILDYFYLNPQLDQEEDWQELRLNIGTLQEQIDEQKLQKYLDLFHTKALNKRVSEFLTRMKNMLGLSEIIKYYPENLQGFQRFIIREYLQYKILQIVFDNVNYANKLCFLGGTCLRLVHENTRFSEDLDFDNFDLSQEDFERISSIIVTDIKKEGYEVEIRDVLKGAFHCYIRFPKLLYKEGLSGYKEEKILIQLDTEPQHFDFEPKRHILNKFDVFTEILTTPEDILLAQKFYAIINRPRSKGRDFFDVIFLLGKTKPNYDYLNLRLGIDTPQVLKSAILERCSKISMEEMARDVAPFLFQAKDEKKVRLFAEYMKQVDL